MAINRRQMALAEQIANGSHGPEWDRAFVMASRVGLDYAIEILTDKAETDCDNAETYRDGITLLRDRIEYIAINGYPVNQIDDEQVEWEVERFQVWQKEQTPEVQKLIQEAEDTVASIAAERGVSLDEAIRLWATDAA